MSPYRETVAIVEQSVEFHPVPGKLRAEVEDLPEYLLYVDDLTADGELAAKLFLQIRRR